MPNYGYQYKGSGASPSAQGASLVLSDRNQPNQQKLKKQPYRPTSNVSSEAPSKTPSVTSNGFIPRGPVSQARKFKGANQYARSQAGRSRYAPSLATIPQDEAVDSSSIATNLGQLTLNPEADVFTSSMAPTPSNVPQDWHLRGRNPSQARTTAPRPAIQNAAVKLTNCTRDHFKKGDIVTVPWHTSILNPHLDPADKFFTNTHIGPAYSKRRLTVVKCLHLEGMFVLPLYTWGSRGISSRPGFLRADYVAIQHPDDKEDVEGMYAPVIVEQTYNKPLHHKSAIHLTGGREIRFQDNAAVVGRLTHAGYAHVEELYNSRKADAQKESWRR